MERPARRLPLWLIALLFAAACGGPGGVVRVTNGSEVTGRFIAPEAYATYLEGTLAEAQGDLGAAKEAYAHATREDPENTDAWARLGRVQCTSSPRAADEALARAAAIDPRSFEAFLARAECDLARSQLASAASAARKAVELVPESEEATRVLVSALRRSGKPDEALRWERALTLLLGREPPTSPGRGRATIAEIDAALEAGNYEQAREAALAVGMASADLALRAAARGQLSILEATSNRALAAEPGSGQALVAALLSADLSGDAGRFSKLLRSRSGALFLPDPLATRLFGELLSRRLGEDAGRTWTQAVSDRTTP